MQNITTLIDYNISAIFYQDKYRSNFNNILFQVIGGGFNIKTAIVFVVALIKTKNASTGKSNRHQNK